MSSTTTLVAVPDENDSFAFWEASIGDTTHLIDQMVSKTPANIKLFDFIVEPTGTVTAPNVARINMMLLGGSFN